MDPSTIYGAALVAAAGRQSRIAGGSVSELAERQIQRWLHSQPSDADSPKAMKSPKKYHYLTISRESGAGGGQIARLVGEIVGWRVFDRELLECLAEKYQTIPRVLELVDETTMHQIKELFGYWLNRASVSQAQYVMRLGRMILMLAEHENVIIVGRGAQFILPQDRGLRVRLVASPNYRVRHIMETQSLTEQEARRFMELTDAGRLAYAQNYFHRTTTDSHLFDLVINVEKLGPQHTAHLISEALKSRFPLQCRDKTARSAHV
jgi:cytidylate kinase